MRSRDRGSSSRYEPCASPLRFVNSSANHAAAVVAEAVELAVTVFEREHNGTGGGGAAPAPFPHVELRAPAIPTNRRAHVCTPHPPTPPMAAFSFKKKKDKRQQRVDIAALARSS